MSFNSVFDSLKDLFPQVDVRILKAVAIEHSKDVQEAVESILFEVLPTISSSQEAHFTCSDSYGVEEANAGLPSETKYTSGCDVSCPDDTKEALSVISMCSDEAVAGLVYSSTRRLNNLEESFVDNDKEEEMLSVERQECLLDRSSSSFVKHCGDPLHSDSQDSNGQVASDSLSFISREHHQDHSCINASAQNSNESNMTSCSLQSVCRENHQFHPHSASISEEDWLLEIQNLPIFKDKRGTLEDMVMANEIAGDVVKGCKEPDSIGSSDSILDVMDETVEEAPPTTIMTKSGQMISIDFLEECVSDAKQNKKTLLLAMESLLDKIREVELQEKAAEQAKVEASKAGMDIMADVENAKQMVHLAKQKNDTLAGEVYGENAILVTEARDLQSRLLILSNERDKSLALVDEMEQTLQERLTAANAERIAAEKEKSNKVASACKALDEQALSMQKVVQESKELEQATEENAKLREFLIDRGHVVDTLQGEIAVICKDVRSLKERIDGGLSLSRSSSSSQIITLPSSLFKKIPSDQNITQAESLTRVNVLNLEQEPLEDDHQGKDSEINGSRGISLDDEWVLSFE